MSFPFFNYFTDRATRLIIATYFLGKMIDTKGEKEIKVMAAFEYADLLMAFKEMKK